MSHQIKQPSGFTLIELLVTISIIALLLGILVPVLGTSKKNANILKEAANLRNIHAGLATYGISNKDWFPGLTSAGKPMGHGGPIGKPTRHFLGKYYAAVTNIQALGIPNPSNSVSVNTAYAQAMLLDEGATSPAQWISPGEISRTGGNRLPTHVSQTVFEAVPTKGTSTATHAATAASTTGMVSVYNNSFAVLAYGVSTLKPEWKSNQNSKSVMMASRMIGNSNTQFHTGVNTSFFSVWTDVRSGFWRGAVVRGDSSTTTEDFKHTDPASPFGVLKYGSVAATSAGVTAAGQVVGPFARVIHEGIAGNPGTFSTPASQVGVAAVSGKFTVGQIASGLN